MKIIDPFSDENKRKMKERRRSFRTETKAMINNTDLDVIDDCEGSTNEFIIVTRMHIMFEQIRHRLLSINQDKKRKQKDCEPIESCACESIFSTTEKLFIGRSFADD